MSLLLDTHAFVWWLQGDARLSASASTAIGSHDDVFVSVASAWEIAIKVGTGKWPEARSLLDAFETLVVTQGLELLGIEVADVRLAGLMPAAHRDPFDRLIAAQALNRGIGLVTGDPLLASLGANIVW